MDHTQIQQQLDTQQNKETLYVIGIGSSAGGLKALEEFFDNCPSNTGFAFVIIQHLSPNYKSLMPELLSRHTEMSVKEAREGDIVLPNHVYLIPGEKNLQIKDGKLELTKRPPSNQINFSINIFFNSLAMEQKEKALAIILSGTGSDGTKGAKSIKEIGGTIFVQSPESSSFDGMPKSVISEGLADFILEPEEMGREIIDFLAHPSYAMPIPIDGFRSNEESLDRILKIIKNHIGYDFFSYKKPTLFRRTAKRISITKCQSVNDYVDYLQDNVDEKLILAQEYLIGVTKFFRDYKAFDVLKKEVIPAIVKNNPKGKNIKIWTVACSTGEEAYSIAILLQQYLTENDIDVTYKIFATDVDERAITVATKGIYGGSIESEVSPEILNTYFIKRDHKFQIHPNIRKNIIFSKHDILQNPPFNKMDLVSCRNMLIYIDNKAQAKILASLHYSLNMDGYLFLGSFETLGAIERNFKEINGRWKIYKNIRPERVFNMNRDNVWQIDREKKSQIGFTRQGKSIEDKFSKSINKILLDEFLAVSICIDEDFEIVYASGKLKKYIQYPEDGYSNNLLKMLPDELNIPIGSAIRKLNFDADLNIEKNIKLIANKKLKHLRVLISTFNVYSVHSRLFSVTIIEESARKISDDEKGLIVPATINNKEQLLELKDALNETRENLQSTIEELETSNEEMQATNEELLASNEELQSTNEELQSLNEELHTVNAELQEKNIQLIQLNSDIENLMENINVGTIFLDRAFQIRKYTPSINQHFQLRMEDIGRSIAHFSGTMGGEDLITHSKQVIQTLLPFRKEVCSSGGKWFVMQIYPYRSQEDFIQGVVINFLDIDELKSANLELDKLNKFMQHLTSTNPAIIYIYDLISHKNLYASSSIWENAGYTAAEIQELGADLLETIVHPDDIAAISSHHEQLKKIDDTEELLFEYRLIHKESREIIWVLSTDKVNQRNEKGEVITILGVAMIITKSKKMERELKESEERFRLAMTASRSGLWEWSNIKNDSAWWSIEFQELLGFSLEEEEHHFSNLLQLIHIDHVEIFQNALKSHTEEEKPFEEEIQIKTKDKGFRWFRINGKMQVNNTEKVKKIVGTLLDVTEQRESLQKMKELNIELERFAYLASHDLKEPLKTVTSFTNLFKEEYKGHFDENALKYLDFIEKASSRMIKLTNDLLVYSQLDDKSLNFEHVNLNTIILKIKEDLQSIISETNAEISIGTLPNILCDASQIKQLFQNLISNSLKYRSDKTPKIQISYIEKTPYYEFCIRDNGIGIKEKYHKQIFEVFKRLHSHNEYEGTGIGLANCKRIIENHNGKIWVKSSENNGSEFFFRIPKKK
ncbi:chemotaxis protein CheB [Kordia sp.]|uniref:chemotaxis protein CheB n=1 Tax=Kordia sp. TaxID=1965332 RepID=UPI003D2C96B0